MNQFTDFQVQSVLTHTLSHTHRYEAHKHTLTHNVHEDTHLVTNMDMESISLEGYGTDGLGGTELGSKLSTQKQQTVIADPRFCVSCCDH